MRSPRSSTFSAKRKGEAATMTAKHLYFAPSHCGESASTQSDNESVRLQLVEIALNLVELVSVGVVAKVIHLLRKHAREVL